MLKNSKRSPTEKKDILFLDALLKKRTVRPPFWLMRQAGRYLPEYRDLRSKAGSFLDLCFNPTFAAEVTLQPLRRFSMDAAILFSDILVIPYALGQGLSFQEGEGPRLEDLDLAAIEKNAGRVLEKLSPVLETVERVRQELDPDKVLIGFAGAPWTVACYMIEGGSSKDFSRARHFAANRPVEFERLMQGLANATADYASAQIKAGADVIQLFDSWAGLADDFEQQVINPTRDIIAILEHRHPGVPIIGFPRGAGKKYLDYARQTGVCGLGLDQHVSLREAEQYQKICTVQGNLDPQTLLKGGLDLETKTRRLLETLSPGPFIFNLGHGVIKETPPEHVLKLSEIVRNWKNV